MKNQAGFLFKDEQAATNQFPSPSLVLEADLEGQAGVAEAERVLLDLADYIYGHTSLKPMSKTLFFISRCLLLARRGLDFDSADKASNAYLRLQADLGPKAPADDFDFGSVARECAADMFKVGEAVRQVAKLSSQADSLGLAFNTLLRGKFEGGEGLGTFLTPEEVVIPMVEMALCAVNPGTLLRIADEGSSLLFGDICGGTGRFVYALDRALLNRGFSRSAVERAARLFDQSSLAVGLARLNFLFDDISPDFHAVRDSLIEPRVSQLKGRFALLATNPPFGTGKYLWNAEISEELGPDLLRVIGLGTEDSADPSELFVIRNLDLLAVGGVLAIVLPDGVLQSRDFVAALHAFERSRSSQIEILGIVSLPSATFALGGTVAKTSFVLFRKAAERTENAIYLAHARHVGFVKRGNRRVADALGNDLPEIANNFGKGLPDVGVLGQDWHSLARLTPASVTHSKPAIASHVALREYARPIREYVDVTGEDTHFHVSVLDVDETGLINVISAAANQPVSRGLRCQPGDLLISCINPRIWRATVVPDIGGQWSCSPEFAVIRPRKRDLAWALALCLHHSSVMEAIQSLGGGTSSSRQRVEKERVMELSIPAPEPYVETASRHAEERTALYQTRLREARLYEGLHDCGAEPQY